MKITGVLKRAKIDRVRVVAGDHVQVRWNDNTVVDHEITGPERTYDEAFVFEGDEDGRYVIGGGLVERK